MKEKAISFIQLLATIGGLTAGFTYIFISSSPQFTKEGIIGNNLRKNLVIFFSGVSFLIAMTTLMLSSILFGYLTTSTDFEFNIIIQDISWEIDLPLKMLILNIFFLYVTGLITLGGNADDWVWYTLLLIGIGSLIYSQYFRFFTRKRIHPHVDKELLTMA